MVRKKSATLILLSVFVHIMVFAQGKVGINTVNPLAGLHVVDSSVLFSGEYDMTTPGNPPVSGAGTRMMWYPDKAAFRAGRVTSTTWDKDSIGDHSVAIGLGVKAKGNASVALGHVTQATGFGAVAMGSNTRASGSFATALGGASIASGNHSLAMGTSSMSYGDYSVALGDHVEADFSSFAAGSYCKASGYTSTAFGSGTEATGFFTLATGFYSRASGNYSTATGLRNIANGYASAVTGMYCDSIVAPQTMIIPTTPLFIIGNGDNDTTRSNAMVVRKDGTIGIGTNTPDDLLHIYKGNSGGAANSSAALVVEDNAAVAINLLTPNANSSAVYFGNASNNAHGGIVYNSTTSNGLAFRTNGNSTKMVVTDIGRVGIGTTTPDGILHTHNGVGGGVYHIDADMIIEDDNAAYLQFSTPDAQLSGILAGNNMNEIRSAIIFRIENAMDLRAGGNITRLRIESDGDIDMFDGEVHRDATADANLLPICYGSVSSAGAILSGTGNFTVTNPSGGRYDVSITDETYTTNDYTVSVSPIATLARMQACSATAGGNLIVRFYDSAGTLANTAFHFVVYKQ